MEWSRKAVLWAALLFAAFPAAGAEQVTVREDILIPSIRKALSVLPNWQTRLLAVNPSPFPGFYEGTLEFRLDENVRLQSIYITPDSKYYIVGNLFDSGQDMDALRREKINLKGAPSQGSSEAPVTIVEYSDLQCGSCKIAHETIQKDKVL